MPSFPNLQGDYLQALVRFLESDDEAEAPASGQAEDAAKPAAVSATATPETVGANLYGDKCAKCHGDHREGKLPTFPALTSIGRRLSGLQIQNKVHQGGSAMPAFPTIEGKDLHGLVAYLTAANPVDADPDKEAIYSSTAEGAPMKFRITGSKDFLDPDGYPGITPPWGTLNAIDLNTGKYLWKIPLGEYPALAAQGMTNTGSENYGGPIVTASDVLFIAATVYDKKLRAFDSQTGELLWQTVLPNAGVATPVTYMVNGRQYVVIAAGGGKDPKASSGSVYVAFSLP